jgi:ankyrin repeat protein
MGQNAQMWWSAKGPHHPFGACALMLVLLAVAASGVTACTSDSPGRSVGVVTTGARRATSDDQRLIGAAGAGNLVEVRRLLTAGAGVRAVDDHGRTALLAASYEGELDVARELVAAGADVNTQDETRQSAYLVSTSEIGPANGLELLELTLAHGADVTALDSYDGTGLIRAADRGFVDIVARLLTTPTAVNHVNRLGWTALLEAIILGHGDDAHVEVVRRLVAAGADVNLADHDGVTPLAHARRAGYDAIVGLLLAAGAR